MFEFAIPILLMALFAILFIALEAREERRWTDGPDWRDEIPPSYRVPEGSETPMGHERVGLR